MFKKITTSLIMLFILFSALYDLGVIDAITSDDTISIDITNDLTNTCMEVNYGN